jgi:tyrosine-protein kinase Etk/Wzc
MLDSDTLKSYRVKLADLQQQLAENNEVLKPAHYKVRQIQAEIDSLQHDFEQERAGILARLTSQYETAKFREDSLTHDYDRQARTVSTQMGKSIQFNELKRDLETRRALYDSMLRQVKEAGVVSAMQASNVHVVDPAVAPDSPIRPNRVLYSAIGLSSGSLFGLVFIFATDRRKFPKAPAALTRKIENNVRQLGAIPMITNAIQGAQGDAQAALGSADNSPESSLALAVWRDMDSVTTESFRNLLPHLLYSSQRASRPRVISVTSATHGEGRTFVACNLATVLAQSGRKVLLVDADRVNPRIHEIFGVSNESGFTELILQQAGRAGGGPTDTVWSTGMPNLFVSPGGRGMARLATLTHDPRLPAVLDRLCGHFDMILIDTPPVFTDGDALAIGQQADGVLMVVRPGQAPQELVDASVEQCLQHGLPVIGKIVNGSEPTLQALAS